jgi:hypothetical protein
MFYVLYPFVTYLLTLLRKSDPYTTQPASHGPSLSLHHQMKGQKTTAIGAVLTNQ